MIASLICAAVPAAIVLAILPNDAGVLIAAGIALWFYLDTKR